MEKRDFKDFRCKGEKKNGKQCNTLLFRYKITDEEIVIAAKCPRCNTFNILHIPLQKIQIKENYENKESLSQKTSF